MAMTHKKRKIYLLAAAMTLLIVLGSLFLYRCAKHGLRYVLNGIPTVN